jgi:hypothetical protein
MKPMTTPSTPELDKAIAALELYRDGFIYHPKRTKTGVDLSEWKPNEKLLDDCGNAARAALPDLIALRDGAELQALRAKADAFDDLRRLAGFVEDGSSDRVQFHQDDATRDWVIRVGVRVGGASKEFYHGPDLISAAASSRPTPPASHGEG